MDHQRNEESHLVDAVTQLLKLVVGLAVVIIIMAIVLAHYLPPLKFGNEPTELSKEATAADLVSLKSVVDKKNDYWIAPGIATLDNDPEKELILYGKDLIVHTSDYFGPEGKVRNSSTNGMNCQNCHLDAGTKVFGNNYSAVASTYPKYRARSGTVETISKRVNDCFERSLNGRALDTNSKEMHAIVSYIKWLGKEVPKGVKPPGSGLDNIVFLDRAADPVKGHLLYDQKCSSCHQKNGQGILNAGNNGFTYPPLWGGHSYNNGAGLFRLSNFAKYVKFNMPLGASHSSPLLTDEEAWDIAAYVNSQLRPSVALKNDWPNIAEKPFDHPYGPYADSFIERQHKYGPFKPIQQANNKSKPL